LRLRRNNTQYRVLQNVYAKGISICGALCAAFSVKSEAPAFGLRPLAVRVHFDVHTIGACTTAVIVTLLAQSVVLNSWGQGRAGSSRFAC
jgi:hypothetical protein